MAEHDDLHDIRDLPQLARAGEEAARPLPADQVRHLGDQRRRRRYTAVAGGALAAVVLAGGVLVAGTGLLRGGGGTVVPPVAATPSAPASTEPAPTDPTSKPTKVQPARTVTTKNLLTVDDVPLEDRETLEVTVAKSSAGRAGPEISRCWPTGRTDLGVTAMVARNFRYEIIDPDAAPDPGPLENEPVVYTQALQFADAAAAKRAQAVYAGWLDSCAKTLEAEGNKVLPKLGFTNRSVDVAGGSATLSEVVYQRPGDQDGENAYWESVGLTQVDDRLMVTVFLNYGMDFNVSLDRSEGEMLHPQLILIESSAEKLAA